VAGGLFGIGGRGDRYGSFTKTDAYDESKYQYGGYKAGAQNERANLNYRREQVEDREAPAVDRGDAMQSRGFQYSGLGQMGAAQAGQTKDMQLLESAATGGQPSRAEILGKQMSDRALRSQVSAAGNVRGGPGAAAAAYRTASQGAMSQRADMAQGTQAERAAELERARGTYSGAMGGARRDFAGAAQGVRGQDENAAQFGASHELASRQTNDARAMGYEQMGQQINRDQLGAGIEQQKIAATSQMGASTLNADANKQNAETDKGLLAGGIGMIGGALGSIFKSDPNAKTPMGGSLAALGLGGMSPGAAGAAPETFSGSAGLLSGSVAGEDAAHKAYGTRFQANPGADVMMSGMVGKEPPSPSAMASKDPYSDPRAKLPVDQEAAKLVAARRAAGGYARPDTTPVASEEDAGRSALHSQIEKDTEGATPYERDEEVSRGVAGAPLGYAKEHPSAPEEEGQTKWTEPDKFGMRRPGANTEDSTTKSMAPGTDDWNRYGEGAKKEGDPDWAKGGATKSDAEPVGWRSILAGSLAGLSSGLNPGPRVVYVDRDTTTSDPKAKAAAFQDGAAHAHVGGPLPDYMKGQRSMQGFSRTDPKGEAKEAGHNRAGDDALSDAHKLAMSPIPGAGVPAAVIAGGGLVNKAAGKLSEPEYKSPEKKKDTDKGRETVMRTTAAGQVPAMALMPGVALGTLAAEAAIDPWRQRQTTTSDERTKRGFSDVDTSDMADAMRSMKASPYQYKSEYRPPEQSPGEVNVGPMADAMAKDEVARTAIVKDDESDMLAIDKDKGLKLVMGSLAALQSQVDDLKGSAPRGNAKKATARARSAHA
jgi:hypothetical protein